MSRRTETAPIVNPTPAVYRRGQSVMVLQRSAIGVVVDIRGATIELAVWPCARLQVSAAQIAPLTAGDACPRSHAPNTGPGFYAVANNHCMPRARDGRCHWCDRLLDESHEMDGEVVS